MQCSGSHRVDTSSAVRRTMPNGGQACLDPNQKASTKAYRGPKRHLELLPRESLCEPLRWRRSGLFRAPMSSPVPRFHAPAALPAGHAMQLTEHANLTMRTAMRRFARLTNAFSKKLENHCHRSHSTRPGTTSFAFTRAYVPLPQWPQESKPDVVQLLYSARISGREHCSSDEIR